MGRRPKQEQIKKFLHNDKTRFLFSDAAEFANVFPTGEVEMYLKPVPKGGRMKKGHFQIVGHLPNDKSDNRESYLSDKEKGSLGRFISGDLKANRMRWNAGSYPGFHLILHDQNGRRQEFFLRGLGSRSKGALVFATMAVPSEKDRKLLTCPVQVGFFGPSASRSGEFKLTLQKPKAECAKGLRTAGHVSDVYQAEEFGADNVMSHEDMAYFYESQGMAYDAESEDATYEPSTEPDMASPATEPTNANFSAEDLFCASCGSYKRAEGHGCGCMGAESFGAEKWKPKPPCEECGAVEGGNIDGCDSCNFTYWFNGKVYHPDSMIHIGAESWKPKPPCEECGAVEGGNIDGCDSCNFTYWFNGKVYHPDSMIHIGAESWKPKPPCEECGAVEGGNIDGCDSCNFTYWFNGKVYHPDSMIHIGAESEDTTCAECGMVISEDDIIGDGTNRGLCCVPDYYDDDDDYPYEAESLEDYNGMESVVVEPPLGHGVAQWYAETATYEPSSEPDMESPATEPTNAEMNAESKSMFSKDKNGKMYARRRNGRIITHNAESSPSSFDITWEDAQGLSSPSLPPEGIHFAETEEAFGSVGEGNNFGQMRAEHEADFVVEKPFTTGAKLSAGMLTGVALFSVAGMLGTAALSKLFDKEE